MAGLLDYITNPVGTVGAGLLGNVFDYYRNMQPPQMDGSGPQYDPMGSFTGINAAPQMAPAPPSVFSTGASPFMSSPSLPQAPQPAPAAPPQAAPQPENPISVGNYQMPRIGNPDEYVPQQVMTPPNAALTQGQAPAQPQMQPGNLPPALQGTSPLARIFNPNGLIAKLTGNDTRSIAQQNLKAQYDALVPIVGPQKAMLAIMNPEAGKTILDQALSSKQKFTEIGVNADGTKQYGFVNEREQKVAPYAAPGSVDVSKGVAGPDGKIIPYPEGLDASGRKAFANHIATINADAATGKMTESQGKAAGFATRMENSLDIIKKFENEGQNAIGRISEKAPFGGAYLQSPEYQRYTAAKQAFINAHLRKDSGASIHDPEFVRAEREFFPQPGEGPDVVREKAARRAALTETTKREAGPGYKSSSGAGNTTQSGVSWSIVQ